MFKLQNLEYLSLRKNELKFKNNSLSHLKNLNLNENNIALDSVELKTFFGFKINFKMIDIPTNIKIQISEKYLSKILKHRFWEKNNKRKYYFN
jgi:Leucine-rich repeat (LRR) protein